MRKGLLAACLARQAKALKMIQLQTLHRALYRMPGRVDPHKWLVGAHSVKGTIRLQFTFHTMEAELSTQGPLKGLRLRVCRLLSKPGNNFTWCAPRELLWIRG